MMRNRSVAVLGLLLVLGAVVTLREFSRMTRSSSPVSTTVSTGKMASDFTLTDLNGQQISLASLRGKVVFLNFWATWCEPCRVEMPSMERLHKAFAGRPDFVMLAISQDAKGKEVVLPYIRKHGYDFEVLLDPDGKVAQAYDVSGVPETFIIDRDGRIVAHHLGAFDWSRDDVREALRELLDAQPG